MGPAIGMLGFGWRILRAAALDRRVYAEVEHDTSAHGQAAATVVLASLAAGFGAGARHPAAIALGALAALLSWFLWAWIVYRIGGRLVPEPGTRVTHGQVLRAVGFASAPGIFRIAGIIAEARALVFAVTTIWVLAATVVAVREAMDYRGVWRAIGVTALGWLVHTAVVVVLLWLTAPAAV
jgi:hypothetical protein